MCSPQFPQNPNVDKSSRRSYTDLIQQLTLSIQVLKAAGHAFLPTSGRSRHRDGRRPSGASGQNYLHAVELSHKEPEGRQALHALCEMARSFFEAWNHDL